MNHEQRVADVERILADLASTVRVLGDHERLLGQHQIRLEEIQLQMGARIAEMGAKIVELTSNQATTQAALQALIAQIDRFAAASSATGMSSHSDFPKEQDNSPEGSRHQSLE